MSSQWWWKLWPGWSAPPVFLISTGGQPKKSPRWINFLQDSINLVIILKTFHTCCKYVFKVYVSLAPMQCCRLIISIFHQVMRLDTNSWSLPFSSSPPKLSPKPVLLLFSILNIHLQLFKTTSLFVPLCIILTLLYIPSTDFTLFRWINYFSKNSFFRPSHQNECLVVSKSRWWGGKVANEGKGVCSPNYIAICVKHGIKGGQTIWS